MLTGLNQPVLHATQVQLGQHRGQLYRLGLGAVHDVDQGCPGQG